MPTFFTSRYRPASAQRYWDEFLIRSIKTAHMHNPASWSLLDEASSTRLHVGHFGVLYLGDDWGQIMLDGSHVKIADVVKAGGEATVMKWIPGAVWASFYRATWRSDLSRFEPAHQSLIRVAAEKQREVRRQARDAHSKALVRSLADRYQDLKQPAYV